MYSMQEEQTICKCPICNQMISEDECYCGMYQIMKENCDLEKKYYSKRKTPDE